MKNRNKNNKNSFRIIKKYGKGEVYNLVLGSIALVVGSSTNLIIPKFLSLLLSAENIFVSFGKASNYALILLLIFIIQALAFYFRSFYFLKVGCKVAEKIRKDVFKCLLEKNISFFSKFQTGDLITRLSSDIQIIQELISFKLSIIFRYSIQILGAICIMLFISWKLSFGIVLSLPALVFTGIFFGKRLKKLSKEVQISLGKSMSLASEALSDYKVVKSLGAEEFLLGKFFELSAKTFENATKRSKFSAFFQSFVNFLMSCTLVLLLLLGLYLVYSSDLSINELINFILYASLLAVSFAFAASSYSDLIQASAAVERVEEVTVLSINSDNDIFSTSNKISDNEVEQLFSSLKDISFVNVDFSYKNSNIVDDSSVNSVVENKVLNNLSFKINTGLNALVGKSGSGKSTIISLILGLYSPSKGEIKLDNLNLESLAKNNNFYSKLAYVSQEPLIFNFTLKENLILGDSKITDEKIWEALESVNMKSEIESLENKLEQICGENGSIFSVGQKQRLSIARVLLKSPKILIFDEPTSSLDSESEEIIYNTIKKVSENKICLVITHKFQALQNFNNILVLENGAISESGSFDQLTKSNGLFNSLIKLQGLI